MGTPVNHAPSSSIGRFAALFALGTVALGLALRWEFVTGSLGAAGFNFGNLRHAHSHGGYYGVLMLPWMWAVTRRARLPRGFFAVYAGVAAVAALAFAPYGYNALTIVLATAVWVAWGWAGIASLRAGLGRDGWLAATPWVVFAASLLIPAVGVTAGSRPALSMALVHFFLGALLLGVFVPMALSFSRVPLRLPKWLPPVAAFAAAGAAAFDTAPGAGAALVVFGAVLAAAGWSLPWRRRVLWVAAALGFVAAGLDERFRGSDARIAGMHFTILGPVLLACADGLGFRLRRGLEPLYVASVFAMSGSIVGSPLLWPEYAALVTAWVSSVTVALLVLGLATGRRTGETEKRSAAL